MAFDLDDDELEATRKMHKSRYINVGSIEENIKILENLKSYLNLLVYEGKDKIIYNDLLWDEKTVDCINAIEHLINDYTRQKQINEEHQKINGELSEKIKALEQHLQQFYNGELYTAKQLKQIEENQNKYFINKQKVKDVLQNNRNELFSTTYVDDIQYKPYTMQIDRINKIERELLEGE